MTYILTVDGGTTNTRAALWDENGVLVDSRSSPVGVRYTAMDGDNHRVCQAVKECLAALIEAHGLAWDQIQGIWAAGMITSNLGLVDVKSFFCSKVSALLSRIQYESLSRLY